MTSNEIVVALYGGLGNQLFQYATARALAAKHDAELVLDLRWFEEVKQSKEITSRNFALYPFKLNVNILDNTAPTDISNSFVNRIRRLVLRHRQKDKHVSTYNERSYTFDETVLNLKSPVRLNGYWQSYKYFSAYESIIKEELNSIKALSPASQELLSQIQSSDAICLHVRRGDYVTNAKTAAFHGSCGLSYYQDGLEIVLKGLSRPKCFVFTDDPSWAKENMRLGLPTTVVDINGPDEAHQDLWLMAACKHFIIANSTLSWWGAWLADYPSKIVVSPAQWFKTFEQDMSDLIPNDWIRL